MKQLLCALAVLMAPVSGFAQDAEKGLAEFNAGDAGAPVTHTYLGGLGFTYVGMNDDMAIEEGTLSVSDALRVFSIRTLVAAKETDSNKKIIKDIVQHQKSNFLSTDYII